MIYQDKHGKTRGHVPPPTYCPMKPARTTYDPKGSQRDGA